MYFGPTSERVSTFFNADLLRNDEWSRNVFARRTGEAARFLLPYLRPGMRLIDCGCGPGSITVNLAQAIESGEAIGIDVREEAVVQGRMLARQRGVSKLEFLVASIYQLPFADGSVDAAFTSAVLQHLAAPLAALREIRRVLKPGGVIGIVDGSSTITFRYPASPALEMWDQLRRLERQHNTGRASDMLPLRALLREVVSLAHKHRAPWPRRWGHQLARRRRRGESRKTT
jgi:ubiquinone/menaquinone biosynthesis C-methylase UbiE